MNRGETTVESDSKITKQKKRGKSRVHNREAKNLDRNSDGS